MTSILSLPDESVAYKVATANAYAYDSVTATVCCKNCVESLDVMHVESCADCVASYVA